MANRYFLNIGVNWGDTANWSDTSGGTGGFSVPTNVDDVFFDANSGNCTVNASARTAKTLDFTGYTNTITMTFGITVSGNVTLAAGMTIAGASGLTINATGNLTSNGKTWPNNLTLNTTTGLTHTFTDTWTNTGTIATGTSGTATITLLADLNADGIINIQNTVTINGTYNLNANNGILIYFLGALNQGTGTTTLNINGGSWGNGTSNGSGSININTNINGNITINQATFGGSKTLTYISGSVTCINSFTTSTTTLNVSGITWNNLNLGSSITIQSDLNINGLLNLQSSNVTVTGAFNINASGGLSINSILTFSGNATLNLLGGTWSQSGQLRLNTNINGNVTISGTVSYNTGTLTYTAGTVKANTATLNVAANSTFINCDKINFRIISITAGTTQTFNKFFSGSAIQPTRISSTGASNYTIAFQDDFEKITKFTKISNCTVSRRGQLLCITDKSNKGGNVGIRYINQLPNGVAKNAPTVAAAMSYSVANISDPNFIIN
jgi:hypothetical protein